MGRPARFARALLLAAALVAAGIGAATAVADARADTVSKPRRLAGGFMHHGVATPVAHPRGIVATVDGSGRDVVLVWLYDLRGGYGLLMVDAATGKSQTFATPFDFGSDSPFASLLSSRNRYYTHFNGHFVEFDPAQRRFTFHRATAPQMAMSMTEDSQGRIWSVTYPQSGVVSYDPRDGRLRDYGQIYKQDWAQYQRSVAVGEDGWVYFGVGNTRSQIIAMHADDGKAVPLVPEAERIPGTGYVVKDASGAVYGQNGDRWMRLEGGKRVDLPAKPAFTKKPIISDHQGLVHWRFPTSGRRLMALDLGKRTMTTKMDADGSQQTVSLDYASEGALIMSVCGTPAGMVCGGTSFPMRTFTFDPASNRLVSDPMPRQFNAGTVVGDRVWIAGYPDGILYEWGPDLAKPPVERAKAGDPLNRPHVLLGLPDGGLVMGGTPNYGLTGGGLLFWDPKKGRADVITHDALVPDQATSALVRLPGGELLGGTTVAAGTGGEVKAKAAELYLLDPATRRVLWRGAGVSGTKAYTDLALGPGGLVYGIADAKTLFVFDPAERRVVSDTGLWLRYGNTIQSQGPRVFVPAPDGRLYLLFNKGIATVDPTDHGLKWLATSPVPISAGGAIVNQRLYFASGSHLYSWALR